MLVLGNMKEDLIKIIAACFLVLCLSKCLDEKTKVPTRNMRERFKPFKTLAVVPPASYEDVIKEAFKRMSSGEKVPTIDCSVKFDISPEDSYSLTKHIVDNLKKTINTLPTPTKVAPMLGEDFHVLDLTGFITSNDVAVVSFMLFHKTRFFAIQCRALATRGSDKPGKTPWFVHKIHYAQENPNENFTSDVKAINSGARILGSIVEDVSIPSVEAVTYPPELDPLIATLSRVSDGKKLTKGIDTKLVEKDTAAEVSLATNERTSGGVVGNESDFVNVYTSEISKVPERPSSVLKSFMK